MSIHYGVSSVVLDESHRFLDWQPSRLDCEEWRRWFIRRGIDHMVAESPKGWSVYKHAWLPDTKTFCCAACA